MARPEQPQQPPQPNRPRPPKKRQHHLHEHARGRYAAISDKRHGKQSNVAFMVGGGFAIFIVLVVIITATSMSTSADREEAARADADAKVARAEELARATAAADAAKLAAANKGGADTATEKTDDGAAGPAPAAPAKPAPAPDVSVINVDYNPLRVGPWWVKPVQVAFEDTYECPRASINQALGETLVLKASAPDRKLMIVYLSVEPKESYTANERAALASLPIIANGQRKLAADEWVLVSDHFALATVDPATGARRADKPLLLFAEDAEAGFSIAGSEDKSRLNYAVFANDPTELVLVFDVNTADKLPLLIVRPLPTLAKTPAFRINITDFGTMGSAGHAPLVDLDPALAPGESRAKPGDATAPAEPAEPAEPTEPAEDGASESEPQP